MLRNSGVAWPSAALRGRSCPSGSSSPPRTPRLPQPPLSDQQSTTSPSTLDGASGLSRPRSLRAEGCGSDSANPSPSDQTSNSFKFFPEKVAFAQSQRKSDPLPCKLSCRPHLGLPLSRPLSLSGQLRVRLVVPGAGSQVLAFSGRLRAQDSRS